QYTHPGNIHHVSAADQTALQLGIVNRDLDPQRGGKPLRHPPLLPGLKRVFPPVVCVISRHRYLAPCLKSAVCYSSPRSSCQHSPFRPPTTSTLPLIPTFA